MQWTFRYAAPIFLIPRDSPAFIIVHRNSDLARDSRPAMSSSPPIPPSLEHEPDPSSEARLHEMQEKLQKLERRDWWLWSMAVVVMLLLTFAVFTMSFPGLIKVDDPFFEASLNRAVRGLIGLVLIFNSYTIYQQISVKRLRREFSKGIEEMRVLQARAEEFERLAMVDSLTGLPNRRSRMRVWHPRRPGRQRYGHPLTVISFDLDKFKQINDTYGHLAGDLVLKEFARRLGTAIRKSDIAARMGGDEFLVLLPECSSSQVQSSTGQAAPHGGRIRRHENSHLLLGRMGGIRKRRDHRTVSRPRRPHLVRGKALGKSARERSPGSPVA